MKRSVLLLAVLAACGSDASLSSSPDAGGTDAGTVAEAASCVGLSSSCGVAAESCCLSPSVPGGSYDRSFDVAGDMHSGNDTFPATVSDFRLDKFEVTVARFRAFVNAGMGIPATAPAIGAGAHAQIPDSGWEDSFTAHLPATTADLVSTLSCDTTLQTWNDTPGPNENRPMSCLTWYEAFAFCIWDGGYLPTEAEWNFAAAGGAEQRAYPWSSPPSSTTLDAAHASYYDGMDCIGDGMPDCLLTDILPVGSLPAGDGRWGQADLAGNLLEWVRDWAGLYPSPCSDCASLAHGVHREVRGGSFASNDDDLRSGARLPLDPGDRNGLTGVRCARPPLPVPPAAR